MKLLLVLGLWILSVSWVEAKSTCYQRNLLQLQSSRNGRTRRISSLRKNQTAIIPQVADAAQSQMTPIHLETSGTQPTRPIKGGWLMETQVNSSGSNCISNIQDIHPRASLLNLYIVLDDYSPRQILFANLNKCFDVIRTKGLGLVIRFHYKRGEPDFSTIQKDVPQIARFLKQHQDLILVIQAGFIGKDWGEWWGSSSTPDQDNGRNAQVRQTKTFVVDTLLTTGIPVALRYPRDIALYYHNNPQVTHHNDCILADGPNGNDVGTFDKPSPFWNMDDIAAAQRYTRQLSGPKGGESCDAGKHAATCPELLAYVKEYRLTYLNYAYPAAVTRIFMSDSACAKEIGEALKMNARTY